jgi:hypothetical protein
MELRHTVSKCASPDKQKYMTQIGLPSPPTARPPAPFALARIAGDAERVVKRNLPPPRSVALLRSLRSHSVADSR